MNDQTTTAMQTCECWAATDIPCASDEAPAKETWDEAKARVLRERAELWKDLAQL